MLSSEAAISRSARMPDLRKVPCKVVVASVNLESRTAPGTGGNSQPPANQRVLSLASVLTKRSLARILRDVPSADEGDLLFVAEYIDQPDVRGSVPPKILNRFARYAAQIPNLRSYLQSEELTRTGPALTCVGRDDREIKHRISPASTSDANKAPWPVICDSIHLEEVAIAAAKGDPPPSHPPPDVLSFASRVAGLPKEDHASPILHGVPLLDRPHLRTVAEFLTDSRRAGVFSDVDHLDDRFVPYRIFKRFALYVALRSDLKGGELSRDSALGCAEDGGRELPADDAVTRRRRSKGKQAAMVPEDDCDDRSLSARRPKPDNVEQSRDAFSVQLQQTQLNRSPSKGKQVVVVLDGDYRSLSAGRPKPDNLEQSRDAYSIQLRSTSKGKHVAVVPDDDCDDRSMSAGCSKPDNVEQSRDASSVQLRQTQSNRSPSKGKQVAVVPDDDCDDRSLSAGRPKPDNVEQSRDAPSVLLQQTPSNRAGNDHDESRSPMTVDPQARSSLGTLVTLVVYAITLYNTIIGAVANSVRGDVLSGLRTRLLEGRSPSAFSNSAHDYYISANSLRRLGSSSAPSRSGHEMSHGPVSDNDRIRRHHPSTEDSTGTPRTGESIENPGFVTVPMPPDMEQNGEEMMDNNDIQTRGGAVDENQHALWPDAQNFLSFAAAIAATVSIQSGPREKHPVAVLLSTFLPKTCIGFCLAMIYVFRNSPLSTKKRLMMVGPLFTALTLHVVTGVCSSFGII